MRTIQIAVSIMLALALALALANLMGTWLQSQNRDRWLARMLEARRSGNRGALTGGDSRVRIVQFYAMSGEMTDAEQNIVCYGVQNAASVKIDPPIEEMWPSMTRCFWVEPRQDTTYTLTATGFDGSTTSASFQVRVKPVHTNRFSVRLER